VSPRIFDPLDLIFHQYVFKFQILQKEKGKFIIKVVKKENCEKEIMNTLMREAKRCVSEPIEVEIVAVDNIERTGRGKLKAVISEASSRS
jgi:phenylacetate-coenzyme A ligase PaaK-like adenylate-forming protein